jgi:hypothetical protein
MCLKALLRMLRQRDKFRVFFLALTLMLTTGTASLNASQLHKRSQHL